MYASKLVFSQVIDHLPIHTFGRCVVRYQGNRYVKSFSCLDQYLCMAFAQLTYRESLRAIEACLRAQKDKLYHMGIRGGVSKSTLADANEARDWRIYADFAQSLIGIARPLYADEELGLDLDNTVYALDASTIDLCLSVFPWALFRNRFGSPVEVPMAMILLAFGIGFVLALMGRCARAFRTWSWSQRV